MNCSETIKAAWAEVGGCCEPGPEIFHSSVTGSIAGKPSSAKILRYSARWALRRPGPLMQHMGLGDPGGKAGGIVVPVAGQVDEVVMLAPARRTARRVQS